VNPKVTNYWLAKVVSLGFLFSFITFTNLYEGDGTGDFLKKMGKAILDIPRSPLIRAVEEETTNGASKGLCEREDRSQERKNNAGNPSIDFLWLWITFTMSLQALA
jgi:hypothetical protein